MNRHDFLREVHRLIQPRTYVEIGVDSGLGLTMTRVPTIGIDPAYNVVEEIATDLHLARTTSDEFFARRDPTAHLPMPIVDLAFIDGMHLAEYALRDYLSIERHTSPTSVIIFDDMLPRNIDEAARYRHTGPWTGDVYKAAAALREQCPELIVLEVNTDPTGTVVVLNPNKARRGALPGYDDWLDVAVTPDPQRVPLEVLDRRNAWNAHRLLASAGWSQLPHLRTKRRKATAKHVRAAFADILAMQDSPHPDAPEREARSDGNAGIGAGPRISAGGRAHG